MFNCICTIPIYAHEDTTKSFIQLVSFDLNNPNKQAQLIHFDDKTIKVTMSEELSEKTKGIFISYGNFSRRFTWNDPGVCTISAVFTGYINPMQCRVMNISDGRYTNAVATFIRDRYVLLNSDTTGGGRYEVDYSLSGTGTHTQGVSVVIDHTSSERNATVGYYAKW